MHIILTKAGVGNGQHTSFWPKFLIDKYVIYLSQSENPQNDDKVNKLSPKEAEIKAKRVKNPIRCHLNDAKKQILIKSLFKISKCLILK